ncbi:MAG: thiamine pyrophosphokinase [Rubellimicrobium sp.]|nr:thiamine pyrophosphokinase [Rubellimicrobium sp.]
MIVDETRPITLVGGGPLGAGDIADALAVAPVAVALDSGADACLAAGITPVAVIGDLDSLSSAARRAFSGRLHRIEEQVTSDFDKGLRHVAAPLIVGVGLSDGRLDHALAGLSTLLAHPWQRCLLAGRETLAFLCPPAITLHLPEGTPFSLFPLRPGRVGSRGLRWPTDGLDFAPGGRIGTSNAVTAPEVLLRTDAPGALVILPRAALPEAARSLSAARPWPQPPRGG